MRVYIPFSKWFQRNQIHQCFFSCMSRIPGTRMDRSTRGCIWFRSESESNQTQTQPICLQTYESHLLVGGPFPLAGEKKEERKKGASTEEKEKGNVAGDEGGAAAAAADSKDLQQQSKSLDKLTDRVEDQQLDSTRVQSAMAALASLKEADWNAMRMWEKELASVKINPTDVDIIANELKLHKNIAERTLRVHKGDAVAAIRSLLQ